MWCARVGRSSQDSGARERLPRVRWSAEQHSHTRDVGVHVRGRGVATSPPHLPCTREQAPAALVGPFFNLTLL